MLLWQELEYSRYNGGLFGGNGSYSYTVQHGQKGALHSSRCAYDRRYVEGKRLSRLGLGMGSVHLRAIAHALYLRRLRQKAKRLFLTYCRRRLKLHAHNPRMRNAIKPDLRIYHRECHGRNLPLQSALRRFHYALPGTGHDAPFYVLAFKAFQR